MGRGLFCRVCARHGLRGARGSSAAAADPWPQPSPVDPLVPRGTGTLACRLATAGARATPRQPRVPSCGSVRTRLDAAGKPSRPRLLCGCGLCVLGPHAVDRSSGEYGDGFRVRSARGAFCSWFRTVYGRTQVAGESPAEVRGARLLARRDGVRAARRVGDRLPDFLIGRFRGAVWRRPRPGPQESLSRDAAVLHRLAHEVEAYTAARVIRVTRPAVDDRHLPDLFPTQLWTTRSRTGQFKKRPPEEAARGPLKRFTLGDGLRGGVPERAGHQR